MIVQCGGVHTGVARTGHRSGKKLLAMIVQRSGGVRKISHSSCADGWRQKSGKKLLAMIVQCRGKCSQNCTAVARAGGKTKREIGGKTVGNDRSVQGEVLAKFYTAVARVGGETKTEIGGKIVGNDRSVLGELLAKLRKAVAQTRWQNHDRNRPQEFSIMKLHPDKPHLSWGRKLFTPLVSPPGTPTALPPPPRPCRLRSFSSWPALGSSQNSASTTGRTWRLFSRPPVPSGWAGSARCHSAHRRFLWLAHV